MSQGRLSGRRIDDRASGDLQPLGGKMPLHLIEQQPAQIVRFEQMAEAARSRQAPARGPDRSRQNYASPANRKAPLPLLGPTG
jgi:hypothetical protein